MLTSGKCVVRFFSGSFSSGLRLSIPLTVHLCARTCFSCSSILTPARPPCIREVLCAAFLHFRAQTAVLSAPWHLCLYLSETSDAHLPGSSLITVALESVPPQVLLVLVNVPDLRALSHSGQRPGMPLGHFLPRGMSPSLSPYSCVFRTGLQLLALSATSTLHCVTFVSLWAVGVASCWSSLFPHSFILRKAAECVCKSKKAALLSYSPRGFLLDKIADP